MSQFVEECRREWRRLRVPSALADEMAEDLAADLREAEADGASEEEVLGSGASDPRAFTGGQIVELAHLTVQIGFNHTYQFTARHLVPNSHKTVRITLPTDLPSRFKVLAVTRPVPGETNTQNNERIWRVTIGK